MIISRHVSAPDGRAPHSHRYPTPVVVKKSSQHNESYIRCFGEGIGVFAIIVAFGTIMISLK